MGRSERAESAGQVELAKLRAATSDPLAPSGLAALRTGLKSNHAVVVSAAARIIGDNAFDALRSELGEAFERFLEKVATDPSCRAKVAVLEALDRVDAPDPAPYLKAIRCVQMEKAWGPPVDSAVPVRVHGILGLARTGYHDLLLVAAELLGDPQDHVRQAAAEAIENFGARAGAGTLLLKFMTGDPEPAVTLASLAGLLTLAPDVALPMARQLLGDRDPDRAEMAAVALGQSAREDALALLLQMLRETVSPVERGLLLRALGYHRAPRALETLLQIVATGAPREAGAALRVLAGRTFEGALRQRVDDAARKNPHASSVLAEVSAAFSDRDPAITRGRT